VEHFTESLEWLGFVRSGGRAEFHKWERDYPRTDPRSTHENRPPSFSGPIQRAS
jgi:hypothetical protein